MISGPVAYLLQAGPPASVGGPKLQFAERPLDAVTKSGSLPTDFHVKMPTLQQEKHVYSLTQKHFCIPSSREKVSC